MLGLLGVVFMLGLAVWLLPRGRETPIANISTGEQAFLAAQSAADQGGRLLSGDSAQATDLLQQAWKDLERASTLGIPAERTAPLEASIRAGLDALYTNGNPQHSHALRVRGPAGRGSMTVGPDGAPYYIGPASDGTGKSVWRFDAKRDRVWEIIKTGDGPNQGIAAPRLLAAQAADLLIVDSRGDLWRWRPSNDKNGGSLTRRRIPGEQVWGDDVRDVGTLMVSLSRGTYNMYVLDPSLDQILRYTPTLDGGQFQGPDDYLAYGGGERRGLPAAVCRPRCVRAHANGGGQAHQRSAAGLRPGDAA